MEYPAKLVDGKLIISPIIEKIGNNVTIKVPSLSTITKTIKQIEDGKRKIQQI